MSKNYTKTITCTAPPHTKVVCKFVAKKVRMIVPYFMHVSKEKESRGGGWSGIWTGIQTFEDHIEYEYQVVPEVVPEVVPGSSASIEVISIYFSVCVLFCVSYL